jgi:disulfide bond formation protein DsbB
MTSDVTAVPEGPRGASPALAAALLVLVIATATIAGAWYFQLVRGLQPCPMCLEQRYAYYLAIPLAALTALATFANAMFGAYHAGVEWKFWAGPAECTGPVDSLGSAGSLLDQLDKVKVVMCDQIQWSFLGISLAGYNALISLLMAAIAVWGVARSARQG